MSFGRVLNGVATGSCASAFRLAGKTDAKIFNSVFALSLSFAVSAP